MKRLVFALAALFLPLAAAAQEATLNGTVTDSTGSVLPGVTVQALHEASGNTFMAVTDGRGAYQIPVRVGIYKITVQLQGFTTVTQNGSGSARWPDGHGQRADVAIDAGRDDHGDRRVTARRNHVVEGVGQHRSAADHGAPVTGPQLDVAGAARTGQPHQRAGRDCRCRTEATFANSSSMSMDCR